MTLSLMMLETSPTTATHLADSSSFRKLKQTLHGALLTSRCTTALQHDKTGGVSGKRCAFSLKGQFFLLEANGEREREGVRKQRSWKGYEDQFMQCMRE